MSIYYLECLAQATYLIQHQDKALIVDPRRDVDAYLEVGGVAMYQYRDSIFYCTIDMFSKNYCYKKIAVALFIVV